MNKIIFTVMLIICSSSAFAQTMVIRSKTGVYTDIRVDTLDRIDFAPCGIVVYSGQTIHTVQIGNQCWLAENLNVGAMINSASGGANSNGNQTNNNTIEKYCYNNNVDVNPPYGPKDYCAIYGGLYQWDEAMKYVTTPGTQGICPDGWHIPTITELNTLRTAAHDSSISLKAVGQGSGTGSGTNTSGFSALLAGSRDVGSFNYLSTYAFYWSSTLNNTELADCFLLDNLGATIVDGATSKVRGLSVRCLKN